MKSLRGAALLAAITLAAGTLAACGGSSSSEEESPSAVASASAAAEPSAEASAPAEASAAAAAPGVSTIGEHGVDVGLDTPVTVPADEPLKVAFFIATLSNSYTQAMADEAQKWGAENGVQVDVIDAQFDSQAQLDQIETTLQNGDYNGWYVTPLDGNLTCNVLTKDAPAQGILVVASNISVCGQDAAPALEQWVPGLLSYVGAEETRDYVNAWIASIAAARSGEESKVLVLQGPAGITISNNMDAALEAAQAADPNFQVVATANTDFTTADAQAKAETLLQAHPDANVIISAFSDMTNGIVNAIEDQGRTGEIAVYDIGAGQSTLPLIEDGSIAGSAVFSPRTHVRSSLDALLGAWTAGTLPERFIPGLGYGTLEEPFIVTQENLSEYTPEY